MQDNNPNALFLSQFSMQADKCQHSLVGIQQSVVKKKWVHLAHVITGYTNEINKLEVLCTNYGVLPKTCLHIFQHLLRQQRRVMRMIHTAQQQTQDDMIAADKGLHKTKKMSLILENL
ncbi:MAG TPA: hypothetical protein EYG66_05825 [Mariprofundaceae bacterium]|nr:hypothetical protein [Mariprofundaceae bacterium]